MASASGVTALAFDKTTYNGTACGTIIGAYVTVTVDGVAAAAQSVTTTLSGGYTFAGGATTNTQVSGPDGRASLPAINVPASGGTAAISAIGPSNSTATASATGTGRLTAKGWIRKSGSSVLTGSTWSSIPATSKNLGGWGVFIDGTNLWYQGTLITSNAVDAVGGSSNGYDYVTYMEGGKAKGWIRQSGGSVLTGSTWSSIPSTAKNLGGWGHFLDGTNLWYQNTLIATNVSDAVAGASNGYDHVTYKVGGVAKGWIRQSGGSVLTGSTWSSIPSTAKNLGGWGHFLDGTTLWYQNSIIATNVTDAVAGAGNGYDLATYKVGGVAKGWIRQSGGSVLTGSTWSSIPSTAKNVGGWGFFLDGTNLWYQNTLIASGVTDAIGAGENGYDFATYLSGTC